MTRKTPVNAFTGVGNYGPTLGSQLKTLQMPVTGQPTVRASSDYLANTAPDDSRKSWKNGESKRASQARRGLVQPGSGAVQ